MKLLSLFRRKPVPAPPAPSPEKQQHRDAVQTAIDEGLRRNAIQRMHTVRETTRYGATMVEAMEILKG